MAQNGLTELRAMKCSVAEDCPVQPGDELSSAIATKLAQHGATEKLLGVPAHLNTYFALPGTGNRNFKLIARADCCVSRSSEHLVEMHQVRILQQRCPGDG